MWDTPVTDAQLDGFYGVPADTDTSAADAARNAIRAILECDFSAEVVAAILQTLNSRLANGSGKHLDDVQGAIGFIDDAIFCLEAA